MRKIVVLLVFVLSLVLPVAAQEETPVDPTLEPTAVVTEVPTEVPTIAPTPEPTPVPPTPIFDNVTAGELLLYLALSALAGGGLLAIILRFIERKDVRDRVEDARNTWTQDQQELLSRFTDMFETTSERILDFLKSVQDGKPNA
jgi:hypothetical protein